MITPEELSKIAKKQMYSIFDKEMETFGNFLAERARQGAVKVQVPAPEVEGIFFYDERQEAFAGYLREKGFKVKKERDVSGGVLQDPSWNLYLY